MDWKLFIKLAKAAEESAKAKYQLAADAAETPKIKEIFEKLAYEEDVHFAVLDSFEKEIDTLATND